MEQTQTELREKAEQVILDMAAKEVASPTSEEQKNTPAESTDTALLREISELLKFQLRQQQRSRLFLRIGMCALTLLVIIVGIGALVLIPRIDGAVASVQEAVETIDTERLNTLIEETEQLARQTGEVAMQAQHALSAIDFETLASTIEDLQTAVQSFSGLDIAKMNEAIENLNAAVEPLASFFGVLK